MSCKVWQIEGLLVVLAAPAAVLAAPVPKEDAKAAVRAFFANVERGAGDSAPLLTPPAKDVIAELAVYLRTGTDEQQGHAVRLIAIVGRRSDDKEARVLATKT